MAEPEWADDDVNAQADLWHAVPRGADVVRFWWRAPAVVTWRMKLDDSMVELKELPVSDQRNAVVAEGISLRSEQTVRELVRTAVRIVARSSAGRRWRLRLGVGRAGDSRRRSPSRFS
jgi:hypothetical protein